jgi:tetratricopeptide (TPR) repeat protein
MYRIIALAAFAAMAMVAMFAPCLEAVEQSVGLRMIIVRDHDEARELLKQLRRGASFSALARAKSIGPPRQQWGMLGLVRPSDVAEPMRSAIKELKVGQISDVLSVADNYAIIKPIAPEIPHLLGQAEEALRNNKPADAIKAVQRSLRYEPDNVQAFMLLGLAYGAAEQFDEALEAVDQAESYAPDDSKIAMLRATLYGSAAIKSKKKSLGRKAIKVYERVLDLDKRYDTVAQMSMGNIYVTVFKQPEKAVAHLQKAAAGNPDVALAHKMLIQAYYDLKQYPQAWKQLRVAQGRGFEFPELLEQLHQVKQQSKK